MNSVKTSALFVKMSSLGDLIHSFPAISDAKEIFGEKLELDWLVDEQYTQLPSMHDGVSSVVPIALRRWRRQLSPVVIGEMMSYLYKLRSKRYDVVIDAQGLLKSALLGSLPARGMSNGYSASCVREKTASLFYGRTHSIELNQHAIEKIRELFSHSLGYQKPARPPDYGLKLAGKRGNKKKIVLIAFCARPEKRWHDEQWVSLAKDAKDAGYEVEFTWGTPVEHKQARRLAQLGGAKLAPELALEKLPGYLAKASGAVSLDTGLAHIVAACEVPNVCLCTATDPVLSGALGKHQLSVGNANELAAGQVWEKLQGLLAHPQEKSKLTPSEKNNAS